MVTPGQAEAASWLMGRLPRGSVEGNLCPLPARAIRGPALRAQGDRVPPGTAATSPNDLGCCRTSAFAPPQTIVGRRQSPELSPGLS